ncbi:MAG: transcriptional repressor LexA, partial [Patescibacteria group bacterium]
MLTPTKQKVLKFINTYTEKKGFSPTLEEMRKGLRLSSISTIHQHVRELESSGHLLKKSKLHRSIEISKNERMIKIPLFGTISAGQPIEAIQDREIIAVPKSKLPDSSETYALRVVGNSMIDENINDGDIILVKHQETAENGQKVVALIDNNEVTLKKFYKEKGQIRLQPANKTMAPLIFKNSKDISIQGIVIDVIREENKPVEVATSMLEEKEKELPLNQIICGDAIEVMRSMPHDSIDLVVTSPPYDGLRDYKGYSFNFEGM